MRRDLRRTLGITFLAGCAAITVAGCGSTHATTAPAPAASRSSSPPPAGTPRQRAAADAAAILASFVAPPGARRLPAAPSVAGGLGLYPSDFPVSKTLVDHVAWWQAPGQPQAVLAWEKAHLPRRFAPAGVTFGTAGDPRSHWSDTFSLPPVPGVLNTRDLVVEVFSAGGGQTAIRLDAQVTWQPPRPAAEHVPSAARVVTITQLRGLLPGSKPPPAPVTITDPAVVRRVAALVDALQVSTLGIASCPAALGGGLELTFRASAGGPALAVVKSAGTCGTVLFSVGGRQQPALADSAPFVRRVLRVTGLRWQPNG